MLYDHGNGTQNPDGPNAHIVSHHQLRLVVPKLPKPRLANAMNQKTISCNLLFGDASDSQLEVATFSAA
jgi:hypothetical protein